MRLHDYLARTGVAGPLDASVESLRRLHVAHRETFLFENLSIQAGGGISVAVEDIERKFLDQARGGYCFEHNTMFAAVLRDIGFATTPLLGRVRRGPPERWARTHMVLRVVVPDRSDLWLADVGFGAIGIVEPIPLRDGATSTQRGITYALRREGDLWVLAMTDATQTSDMYEFSDDAQTIGDVIVANHYTSTHPESMFRRTLTIQSVQAANRIVLRNETLTRWTDGRMTEETVERSRLPEVAKALFGITLPAGPFVYEAGSEGSGNTKDTT